MTTTWGISPTHIGRESISLAYGARPLRKTKKVVGSGRKNGQGNRKQIKMVIYANGSYCIRCGVHGPTVVIWRFYRRASMCQRWDAHDSPIVAQICSAYHGDSFRLDCVVHARCCCRGKKRQKMEKHISNWNSRS